MANNEYLANALEMALGAAQQRRQYRQQDEATAYNRQAAQQQFEMNEAAKQAMAEDKVARRDLAEREFAAQQEAAQATAAQRAAQLPVLEAKSARDAELHGLELEERKAKIEALKRGHGARGPAAPKPPAADKFDTARFNAADKLRDDFEKKYKPFADVGNKMAIIQNAATDPSGQNDMALVFSFMKMLDPGSVVRESEYAQAVDTGSLYDKLRATAEKIKSGQKLTPEMRQNFVKSASKFAESSMKTAKKVRSDYDSLAKRRGLDPGEIMLGIGDDEPAPSAGPQKMASGPQKFGRFMVEVE